MKKLLLYLFLICIPISLYSQEEDAMKLIFEIPGDQLLLTMPLFADTLNIDIDWGDGITQTCTSPAFIGHVYENPGEYTVLIDGMISHIGYTHPSTFFKYLTKIESWGYLKLKSLENTFAGISMLESIPDSIPSGVTNTSSMFYGATNFNCDLSNWDVSNIEQMESMFAYASGFNQDLSSWDVSNVANFNNIFLGMALSTENYSNTLAGWSQLNLQRDVHFVGGFSQYDSIGAAAKQKMINDFNWTFTDGGRELELSYFNLVYQETGVMLSWETEPEVNQYKFFIERMQDTISCGGLDLTDWYSWEWELVDSVEFSVNDSYTYLDSSFCPSTVEVYYRLKQVGDNIETKYSQLRNVQIEPVTGIDDPDGNEIPTGYSLLQNYPNPFNPTTIVKYNIVKNENVSLKVYDVLGREVKILVNEMQLPGKYEVEMNGSGLSSGVYIYRLQAGDFISSRKMVLLK